VVAKVRELQAQWQQHAKSRPLPHRVENALWAEFKAATGAVMSRREDALKARNVQSELNQTTREALISRLQELGPDEAPAAIKRILATVETEWRQAGEVPGNQASRLESRYRDAREKALQYIANSAQRRWHGTCDTLAAKLALCAEKEALSTAEPDQLAAIEARWAALPAVPTLWEQALLGRFKSGEGDATSGALDEFLLQLESALDIPSPDAFQAARRSLKLLAMKNAMEGRRPATAAPTGINELTAAVFACRRHSAEQARRLEAIVVALRSSPPGSLKS
jgi:hypothetical protein